MKETVKCVAKSALVANTRRKHLKLPRKFEKIKWNLKKNLKNIRNGTLFYYFSQLVLKINEHFKIYLLYGGLHKKYISSLKCKRRANICEIKMACMRLFIPKCLLSMWGVTIWNIIKNSYMNHNHCSIIF